MNEFDARRDLPVLKEEENSYLPIPIVNPARRQKEVFPEDYPAWRNVTSQRWIRDLVLDPAREDLWLATDGGILYWQLASDLFTRYRSEHGLAGNAVESLALTSNGIVWAAHQYSGLSYFQNGRWQLVSFFDQTSILCLGASRTETLWIATADVLYSMTRPDDEPHEHELPPGLAPRKLAVGEDGAVWICNACGVYRYTQGQWEIFATFPDVLTLTITGDHLWLGRTGGLGCLNWQTCDLYDYFAWPRDEITALAPAHDGAGVWVASQEYLGLARIDDWTPLQQDIQTLTDDTETVRVTCLANAGFETLWIGTQEGLLRSDAYVLSFHLTDLPPDVIDNVLQPMATLRNMVQALEIQQTKYGPLLWIGTPEGLFRLECSSERWKIFFLFQDVPALKVHAACEEVWAACWPDDGLQRVHMMQGRRYETAQLRSVRLLRAGLASVYWAVDIEGLFLYNGEKWDLVLSTADLPGSGWIRDLVQVEDWKVWLALPEGLFLYHLATRGLYPVAANQFAGQTIHVLLADAEENLWIGTDRGLSCLAKDGVVRAIPNLARYTVTALYRNVSGNLLWVGTNQGLFSLRYEGNNWIIQDQFQRQNSGLGADQITALACDESAPAQQTLWIGTPCGLSCYCYERE